MQILYTQRASAILYRLLKSSPTRGPWILPANVCPIVPLTLLKAGVEIELLDIDPDTFALDAADLLQRVTAHPQRYGGVLFVHTYGRAQPVDGLFEELRRIAPALTIVDDRCVCWPNLDAPDSNADVVLYSTGYSKPIDIGGGGFAYLREGVACAESMLPFDAADLDRLTARYKAQVAAAEPISEATGDWLDLTQPDTDLESYRRQVRAAFAPAQAHHLELSTIYRDRIPAQACLPQGDWRFQIRVPERDRLLASLFAAGLFAGTHFAPLTGIFATGRAPVATALHASIVNLFNDRYYTRDQATETAEIVCRHLETEAR